MRVHIFQSAAGGLSQQQRLDKLSTVLAEAQTDIVVCPELYMSGYHIGEAVRDLAETQEGPFAQKMVDLAVASSTAILYGYPERVGQKIYNSALCIDKFGQRISNHRKMMLPPGFESNVFDSGEHFNLFTLQGVPCAILICYDAEFPEAVRAASIAGAQIIFVPTALIDCWKSVALQMMPTRAFENGVWLVYANHAGKENNADYLGCSGIVAPDGTDAARAGKGEVLLGADLDMRQVALARKKLPYCRDLKKIVGKLSY